MKGMFFDASGVLYHQPHRNQAICAFLERHGLPIPDVKQVKRLTKDATSRAGVGALNREAYFDILLAAWGVTDPSLRAEGHAALAANRTNFVLYPGVVEVLQTLRARSFKLGVVTDTLMTTEEILGRFAQQGLDIVWDAFANSMDVQAKKPDPRMYLFALAQSGVAARDAVFVGHDQEELDGAKALGLTTVAVLHKKPVQGDFVIDRIAGLLSFPLALRADPGVSRVKEIGLGLVALCAGAAAQWGADLPVLNWL